MAKIGSRKLAIKVKKQVLEKETKRIYKIVEELIQDSRGDIGPGVEAWRNALREFLKSAYGREKNQ